MRPIAVVAVGGNALTAADEIGTVAQIEANAATFAARLAELANAGWGLAVVHGNGPQVGNLSIQQDEARALVPGQPLHSLCAMTQGQLGSILVRAIDRHLGHGRAVTVVTHVTVDPEDPAFSHPTKPIGPFFSAERAAQLAREHGWQIAEDSQRGHRRVIASPAPAGVLEMSAVRTLLDAGFVVLAAGGGGVAVTTAEDGQVEGVDAVIDKDSAAARLAVAVDASDLYLLTGVDAVQLDHGTPRQRAVHRMTVEEAERYLAEGQFPAGSMGPKVTAALHFLRGGGHRAIITSAIRLPVAAAGGDAGTVFEHVQLSATGSA
jgi:carbamate kinase